MDTWQGPGLSGTADDCWLRVPPPETGGRGLVTVVSDLCWVSLVVVTV